MLNGRNVRRAVLHAILIALTAVLALAVIGFLIASVLLALLTIASPPVATLLTALCLAAVASLLALFLVSSRRRTGSMLRGAGTLLPGFLGIVKRRPLGAVGTAMALGVVAELLQRDGGGSTKTRRS